MCNALSYKVLSLSLCAYHSLPCIEHSLVFCQFTLALLSGQWRPLCYPWSVWGDFCEGPECLLWPLSNSLSLYLVLPHTAAFLTMATIFMLLESSVIRSLRRNSYPYVWNPGYQNCCHVKFSLWSAACQQESKASFCGRSSHFREWRLYKMYVLFYTIWIILGLKILKFSIAFLVHVLSHDLRER